MQMQRDGGQHRATIEHSVTRSRTPGHRSSRRNPEIPHLITQVEQNRTPKRQYGTTTTTDPPPLSKTFASRGHGPVGGWVGRWLYIVELHSRLRPLLLGILRRLLLLLLCLSLNRRAGRRIGVLNLLDPRRYFLLTFRQRRSGDIYPTRSSALSPFPIPLPFPLPHKHPERTFHNHLSLHLQQLLSGSDLLPLGSVELVALNLLDALGRDAGAAQDPRELGADDGVRLVAARRARLRPQRGALVR
ncbi:hypothetical protein BZA05DRAFT_247734 [Tricharina praecox]|uniref:uncharacterized protein n=1 Tax=Tricharina praecox TaxID=43433 RepID=UPI00221E66FE|nr:uncharacterized protein BZA05DRAFT_247734 [Tricharina praecox]KAI5854695.1 hypothetical protein BZA05DRAFT_247734 [Tricharina praecox]